MDRVVPICRRLDELAAVWHVVAAELVRDPLAQGVVLAAHPDHGIAAGQGGRERVGELSEGEDRGHAGGGAHHYDSG